MDPLTRLFPAWGRGYGRAAWRGDLAAGLTVGVMLVPQGMAYALLAGVPPIYGLYASLVPLLVYPLFGTSRHLAVGTIAIDMLIVASGLAGMAAQGSARYVALVVGLAAMVGVLQLGMGAARLGFIVNLLSRPVVVGFTSAAALVIAFSQLGNLLGVALPDTQQLHVLARAAARQAGAVQVLPLAVGLASVAVLVGLRAWQPRVPGALVVVAAGMLAAWTLELPAHGLAVAGVVPTGLPSPALPVVAPADVGALVPTAVTLALVQFMSVMSLARVYAARYGYRIDPNRELLALGAANLAGSVFRSIPVSGSFSRTAVNAQAGAKTPFANVVAAGVVGLTLLFLTPLFAYLPVPVLAAIIIVAALGLLDVPGVRYLLRVKRLDGAIAVVTFVVTLGVGVQAGLLAGIAASVTAVMYRISRPNVAVLGHLPGTRSFRDVARHPEARPVEGVLLLRVDASFSFANAAFLQDLILDRSLEDPSIRAVVLDASSINDLDTTAAEVLRHVAETLAGRGVALYFGGVKSHVRDTMRRTELVELLGEDHFFLSPYRAVEHLGEGRHAEGRAS